MAVCPVVCGFVTAAAVPVIPRWCCGAWLPGAGVGHAAAADDRRAAQCRRSRTRGDCDDGSHPVVPLLHCVVLHVVVIDGEAAGCHRTATTCVTTAACIVTAVDADVVVTVCRRGCHWTRQEQQQLCCVTVTVTVECDELARWAWRWRERRERWLCCRAVGCAFPWRHGCVRSARGSWCGSVAVSCSADGVKCV